MKNQITPEQLEQYKQAVVPDVKGYLFGLKRKHKEAMLVAIDMAFKEAEVKIKAIVKSSKSEQHAENIRKIFNAREKAQLAVDAKFNKLFFAYVDKHGLRPSFSSFIYSSTENKVFWRESNAKSIRSDAVLSRELFCLRKEIDLSLYDLKKKLMQIQEVGVVTKKPADFPEPIKTVLTEFSNRKLLPASIPVVPAEEVKD